MENIDKIKHCYGLICDLPTVNETLQLKVEALQFLEAELGVDFKNTEEFYSTMDEFIISLSGAEELRRIREANNWSQGRLASHLGVSQQFVMAMESGKKPLTKKVLRYINNNQN